MRYKSTRNSDLRYTASKVIAKGISQEGGLFVPESFPDVRAELSGWAELDYCSLAERILPLYLSDFTQDEIINCVTQAYSKEKFGGDEPVKLKSLDEKTSVLELWHGPTCAFKDMALQLLPQLLPVAVGKTSKTAVILVATSGDTGKAALEGFKDVPGTKIIVFYPVNGVSDMQKLQMTTAEGENLRVCAVEGNFDDTQTGVKSAFTDERILSEMEERGLFFSSANSINFGRLLPQIIYYFYAYFQLYRQGRIKSLSEPINVAVPTGNFGNILAAYYAGRMGLPVNKFICASNENNILTEFINTGHYDKKREFFATTSPSMDILVSSNLERLLYHICGEDSGLLQGWMDELGSRGEYQVDEKTAAGIKELFYGGYCGDDRTIAEIGGIYSENGYLSDTHTAVALKVFEDYRRETGDKTLSVVVSTASPYKFPDHVLEGLGRPVPEDPFSQIFALEEYTCTKAQPQLKTLREKEVRFKDEIAADEMKSYVSRWLEHWGAEG